MSGKDEDQALRVRAALGRWFWGLAVALAVIALLAGFVTYNTHISPGTHTEEQVESSWSTQATFTHEAPVVESNPVFPQGSTLENRSIYYSGIAPEFNGTYAFSYGSSVDGDLTVTTQVVLQLRSVGEGDGGTGNGEQTVYWEQTRPLASRTVSGVSPGETVEASFSLNTTAVDQRLDAIESSLGGSQGNVEARIVAWNEIEGTVAGTEVQDREVHPIPLSIGGGTYSFGDDGPWQQEYQQTRQVQVPNEYGPVRSIGAPLLMLLSLLGLVGLGFAYSEGLHELSSKERATLAYRRNRSEYDEWITRARLPKDSVDEDPARVPTLEDLVDLAIDTDERVIEDPRRNAYIVTHDGVTYVYSPPVDIEQRTGAADADPL